MGLNTYYKPLCVILFICLNINVRIFGQDPKECPLGFVRKDIKSLKTRNITNQSYTNYMQSISSGGSPLEYHWKEGEISYSKTCGQCHMGGPMSDFRQYNLENSDAQTYPGSDSIMDLDPLSVLGMLADASWQTMSGSINVMSWMEEGPGWGTAPTFDGHSGMRIATVRIAATSPVTHLNLLLIENEFSYPSGTTPNSITTTVVPIVSGTPYQITPSIANKKEYHAKVFLVDIEPDANIAGIIGDTVKSTISSSTIKHFVTPRKTSELSQDYVVVQATGIAANQITPGHLEQIVYWEGGTAVSGDPLKRRVKRDVPGKTELKIKTKLGGSVTAQMNVWVVWAPVVLANKIGLGVAVDIPTLAGPGTRSGTDWEFEALIQPSSIIVSSDDIPDLTGAPANPQLPPESSIGNHALDGQGFAPPLSKWDLSRCWRAKTIAPNVTAADCDIPAGSIIANDYPTPSSGKIHATTPSPASDHYPSNLIEGNDYRSRSQSPHTGGMTSGKLIDDDTVRHFVKTSAGGIGNQIEARYQFGAFSRIQIEGKWYRISDRKFWRFNAKYKKVSEQAQGTDYNGDGDKLDTLWINNGTTSDDTNVNF